MNKVIVAEDEYWVRKGIISKVKWDELGLLLAGEASNGDEALSMIISMQPDIVLIDIQMPLLDGLSVIREAGKSSQQTKFVIISGYNDFEYAKEAIKLSATDYLLKPVEDSALGEVLAKIVKELDAERERKDQLKQLETKISENGILIRDSMLNDLLFNEKNYAAATKKISENGILFEKGKYEIAIARLISYKNSVEDDELNFVNVRNTIEEVCEIYKGMLCFKSNRKSKELIIIFNIDKLSVEKVRHILMEILDRIQNRLEMTVNIGAGSVVYGFSNLHSSYEAAYNALRHMVLEGGSNKAYYYEEKSTNRIVSSYFSSDLEMLLEKLVKDTDLKPLIDIINHIFIKMKHETSNLNYVTFEDVCVKLFSILEKYCRTTDVIEKSELQRKLDFYEILEEFNDLGDAHQWFLKYLEEGIISSVSKTPRTAEYTIIKIKDYINRNYSKEISLKDVSEKFFIHPNYFSRLFKEKIGMGFNEYLTSVRMQKAIELMEAGSSKIEDIAAAVGYENQRYFSAVFKKHFDVTPTDYIRLNVCKQK